MNRYYTKSMSDGEEISSISQDPVNILFNPSVIQKKDVWQINIVEILKMLIFLQLDTYLYVGNMKYKSLIRHMHTFSTNFKF